MNCDCLTQYDASLPHAPVCPCQQGCHVRDDMSRAAILRDLAELASYRDIDAALFALRRLSPRKRHGVAI
jgi:hypothetical protein